MPTMLLKILIPVFMLFAMAPFAHAAFKWVDKDGRVHYSDREPAEGTANVEEKSFQPSSNLGPALSFRQDQAVKFYPITIYTIPECRAECSSGREFLSRRKIPYTEKVINSLEDVSTFTKQTGIDKVIAPVMKLGPKIIRGYDESLWQSALTDAGYIRTGADPPPAAPNRAAPAPASDAAPTPTPATPEAATPQTDTPPANPAGQ